MHKTTTVQLKRLHEETEILLEQGKYEKVLQRWSAFKATLPASVFPQVEMECDFQIASTTLSMNDFARAAELFNAYLSDLKQQAFSEESNSPLHQQSIAFYLSELAEVAAEYQRHSLYEESRTHYQRFFTETESLHHYIVKENTAFVTRAHKQYAEMLINQLSQPAAAIAHLRQNYPAEKLEDIAETLGDAHQAVREYSSSAAAYEVISKSIRVQRNLEDSLLLSAQQVQMLLKQGSAHYFAKEFSEALQCYEESKSLSSEKALNVSPQLYLNIAELLIKLSKIDEALSTLDEALDKHPQHAQFAYISAMVHLKEVGDKQTSKDAAMKKLEKVVEIDNQHIQAFKQIGMLLMQEGKYEKAEEKFLECLRINKNDTDALYQMAYILHYFHKSNDDALLCYHLCLDVNPSLVPPMFQIAVIQADAGNKLKAIEMLERALKIDDKSQALEEFLNKLRELQQQEK